ncbi:chromodomain Y-like protein-like isoform X3 [Pontoporia blainvillei]|uniref:Chromodomain Y-like protein-like isoform X3 n=1 Tax=Pontoporia blainvillei TaxID=48723 RepID=A0ABX0S635_PONBL|nr:chromodomain Y-like protein-like isoform X3 [Pontoporia blainvillei]
MDETSPSTSDSEADGKHLQVQGHRRLEAGRLHPHPAVHEVVQEQLTQPRCEDGSAECPEHGRRRDSKPVLLGRLGTVFCCGPNFIYFIRRRLTDDRKRKSTKMAEAFRNLLNTFIQFKKPIIAAVNSPAIGRGESILPICDVVWANEKARFQTPDTIFGQRPDGCTNVMFPKELASCNLVVLVESKALVRCSRKLELEQANERECEFSPHKPITPKHPTFITSPSLKDRIDCVAYVFEINSIDNLSSKMVAKFKQVQKEILNCGVAHVALLTKVNNYYAVLPDNFLKMNKSMISQSQIQNANKMLGIPLPNIFLVENYASE